LRLSAHGDASSYPQSERRNGNLFNVSIEGPPYSGDAPQISGAAEGNPDLAF